MKAIGFIVAAACAALMFGCAANVPTELLHARLAYQHADSGTTPQLVPADLHTAREALDRAEESYSKDGKSYRTLDLAYVAQRKAEMADVLASIATQQKAKTGSDQAYQATQADLLQTSKDRLSQTQAALLVSQQTGQQTADQLAAAQAERVAADQKTADAMAALAKLAAVKEEERGLVITLSGSVLFTSDQSTLMPGSQSRLDQVAAALIASSPRSVVVEGFTDSQGTDQYNIDLSQRRAEAVRDYLVQRGVDAASIQAHGIGEARPVADNTTAEGRANNRRVEIILQRTNKL